MATIKCPSCDREIDAGSFVCEHCGYSLTSTPSVAPGPPRSRQPAPESRRVDVAGLGPPPPARLDVQAPPPGGPGGAPPPGSRGGATAARPPGRDLPLEDIVLGRPDATHDPTTGAVSQAWDLFKTAPAELVGMFLIIDLLGLPTTIYQNAVAPGLDPEAALSVGLAVQGFQTILGLLQTVLGAGTIVYWLKLIRRQDARFSDLFAGFRHFLPIVVTTLLTGLGIALGTLLLVVPGVILMLGWLFVVHVIVDKNLGYIDAIKASWRLTHGHKLSIFVLTIVLTGVVLLGVLACCVGVLVAAPVAAGAVAVVYDRLAEPGNAYLD
jgi:uncharacterized membrane protein